MAGGRIQRARRRLWEACNLCHWCQKPTTWETPDDGKLSPTAATIDHLYSRVHPERKARMPGCCTVVLACFTCNRVRAKADCKKYGQNPPRAKRPTTPGVIGRVRSLVYSTAWSNEG